VQLIDGGLSDNLGVRALSERLEGYQNGLSSIGTNKFKNILVIVVDAEVEPVHNVDEQSEKPSIADTMAAFSNIQFELFNTESRILLDSQLAALKKQSDERGAPVNVFKAGVSFKNIAGKSLKDHLNGLPTSLELPPGDVDLLVQVGGDLLRRNSDYRDFLRAVDGQRDPVSPASTSPTVSTSKSP
jgi:NTE family protein